MKLWLHWRDTIAGGFLTALTPWEAWRLGANQPDSVKAWLRQEGESECGQVIVKSRIILDCERSNVSRVAARTHKAVLPRVSDAVQSILTSMSAGRKVTLLIADITDAFWLVPLRKEEQKFFTATLRSKFYSFNRTAQGSRSAPLTFAALLATAGRWVASAVEEGMHVQIYVDDPIVVGSSRIRSRDSEACVFDHHNVEHHGLPNCHPQGDPEWLTGMDRGARHGADNQGDSRGPGRESHRAGKHATWGTSGERC